MITHRHGPAVLATVLAMGACGSETGTGAATPASIQVTTTTTGADLDLDGYLVQVGAEDPRLLLLEDTLLLSPLDAGAYTVILQDVAANCVADAIVQNVTASDGSRTVVPFHVSCNELPPATVDVTGTWEGTYEGRDHIDNMDLSGSLYYELTQSGDEVTGKMWCIPDGGNRCPDFSAKGRVSGNELELFILGWTEPLISWQVRLRDRGIVSGSEMTGVTSEQMGAWTGTWTVTLQ